MKETGASATSGGKAVAQSLVAAALALSLVPSVAYADTEKAGTDATAANNESVPTLSENEETSSTADYTATLLAEDSTESNTYDLSSIDLSKIKDGTYTATATVVTDDSENWKSYDITVKVTIASGKITAVTSDDSAWPDDSYDYMGKALNGNKRATGMASKIIDAGNTNVDGVTGATISSNAIKAAVYNALTAAYNDQNTTEETSEYTYGYVGLTWAEYWANEGVYNATDTSSSDELDYKGEADKGGFDTVSRATTNHGLHRGSYQCIATIHTTAGNDVSVAYWESDGSAFYTTDGTKVGYSRGTLTYTDGTTDTLSTYDVSGLKYVPVAVKTSDLDALKAKYTFVANGETLQGGYGEKNLSAYSVTANVTANTYGLKTATNNDGSFSFSARSTTGTESGIADQALKTASNVTAEVKEASGSYGEFLRVDLTGDYGDLGANMQAVTWTYYGTDSSRTTALATYGTKFAADNWMHKSMGIQLGLTDSARCQLPEGTDGTGYWTVTVAALGYEDASFDVQVTSENIVDDATLTVSKTTMEALQAAYDKGAALNADDYTEETYAALKSELEETKADYIDKYAADKSSVLEAAAKEQITHLNDAIDSLKAYEYTYVWMNIPYSEFYANELSNNDVAVDVFTSATKTKTRTGSLAGGSYHADSTGESILGITFPVKVAKGVDVAELAAKLGGSVITDESSLEITTTNRGKTSTTTYTGKDALFEAASYSYYLISGDAPSYYKELSLDESGNVVFSEVKGSDGNKATATELTGITSELTTDTTYGDYELDFADELKTSMFGESGEGTVYAATVNTTDDTSYGLRHLENIWRTTELAWCTGFTEKVHNCPTSSEHYKSMMGKTIESVTYYTSNGIYEVQVNGTEGTYVPVVFDTSAAAVESAQVGAESTAVTLPELPEGFEAVYSIEGWGSDVAIENGTLAIPSGQANGSYTLTVTDKSGKYASFSADFELKADAAVSFDDDVNALKTTDGSDITAYAGAISSVTLNGQTYKATGKGSTKVFNDDGTLITDSDPVASLPCGSYEITISATGYNDLTVTYTKEAITMYRLYNPNSGEHFYTASVDEKNNLVSLGWNDEGTGWIAPEVSGTPVYRLYNPNPGPNGSGEHHYTMDAAERDMLIGEGWNDEGIGWYSDPAEGTVLYREYNPNAFNCNHNYTTSKEEHDGLVALGWIDEGLAWYGVAAE